MEKIITNIFQTTMMCIELAQDVPVRFQACRFS